MADGTGIEWTDATWNPVRGCTRVSEGCRYCYAERVAVRFSRPGMAYEGLADSKVVVHGDGSEEVKSYWTGKIRIVEEHMEDPLRWKRPRRIFVNSMSDLFHDNVPDVEIDRIFGVMALSPQHTFQVLTKRPKRMLEYLTTPGREALIFGAALKLCGIEKRIFTLSKESSMPLPNVWLGVSVEHQAAADERIPLLLNTPAAVRFLSCEPLLGLVDLDRWMVDGMQHLPATAKAMGFLDWVIVGGESGPHARPMDPDWARALRDKCEGAGVPFFLKQHGEWSPGAFDGAPQKTMDGGNIVSRIGKKRAGAALDGREHREFPR